MSNMVTIGEQPPQEVLTAQMPAASGLKVTEKAVKRIRMALAKEGIAPEEGGLRLGVMGGGCSGLSYSIKFDTRAGSRL
jgi:iron-sulfur cluster assembly protein